MNSENIDNQPQESYQTPLAERLEGNTEDVTQEEVKPVESKGSFWQFGGCFPNIADMMIMYMAVMVAQLIGQLIAHICGLEYDGSILNSADDALRYGTRYAYGLYSLVSYSSAMLISLLFIILWKRYRGDKGRLLYFVRGANLAHITLWGVLLTLCLGIALEPLLEIMPLVPEYSGRGLPAIISLIVVAPILEEIICRGVILEALRRKGGVVLALIVSSLFFALLHAHITLVLNSFIMGLLLGYFYIRTKSIIVPIILHAINNALAYILLYTNNANFTLSDIILNRDVYFTIYAAALVILIISAVKIGRKVAILQNK